jgi:hypothetical protein
MRNQVAILALALAAAGTAAPAQAEDSAYTSLDLAACKETPANPDDPLETGVWRCTGYLGIPVLLVESDLRFFVSYGDGAASERAFHQTLPPFNYINDTLEWRLDDDGQPFATILRFFTDSGDGGPQGQVLVVTRLGDGGVCHVAYIDALANADANVMARQVADLIARNYSCSGNEPLWIGDSASF